MEGEKVEKMDEMEKEFKTLYVLIILLIAFGFLAIAFVWAINTTEYYEVEIATTDNGELYAFLEVGTRRERFEMDEDAQAMTLEVYKGHDTVIPTWEYLGKEDVYVIDGKAYIERSAFSMYFGGRP